MVEDCARKTKDQASRRFEMIGEFEEEIVLLSDKMATHSLTGTCVRLKGKVNILAAEEAGAAAELEAATRERTALEADRGLEEPVETGFGELVDSVRNLVSEINIPL